MTAGAARVFLFLSLFLLWGCTEPPSTQELVFDSGAFRIVGDLRLPEGRGPHPIVLFVHGDGPNDRTSSGTYSPIMARVLQAGYATFAWDKPGTGGSSGQIDRDRLLEERSRIVLDAIAAIKTRPEIDPRQIGLWGISQAGYVMPMVLTKSEDVAFMIAVSCPGTAGVDQGAYLVASQMACAGLPEEETEQVQALLSTIERVDTYEEYAHYKAQLDSLPIPESAFELGYTPGVKPEEAWHHHDPGGEYFWNPMEVIAQTSLPVLAIFGSQDTQVDPFQGAQAYWEALAIAGNPHSRVELIPGTDHTITMSETGCLAERDRKSASQLRDYPPQYLDLIEAWLRELRN